MFSSRNPTGRRCLAGRLRTCQLRVRGRRDSLNRSQITSLQELLLEISEKYFRASQVKQNNNKSKIYSQLTRLRTARGSCTCLVTVGPAKVKACKSILFNEGSPEVEITWLIQLTHFILSHFAWLLYAIAKYSH